MKDSDTIRLNFQNKTIQPNLAAAVISAQLSPNAK